MTTRARQLETLASDLADGYRYYYEDEGLTVREYFEDTLDGWERIHRIRYANLEPTDGLAHRWLGPEPLTEEEREQVLTRTDALSRMSTSERIALERR